MALKKIPETQQRRIAEIRRAHLAALDETLDAVDTEIRKDASEALARIKASNYKPTVIRRETEKIAAGNNDRVRRIVAESVRDAALYADRTAEVIRHWRIEHYVSASEVKIAQKASKYDFEAVLAREKLAPLKTPQQISAALRQYGSPKAGVQPTKGVLNGIPSNAEVSLSQRLHGNAAYNEQALRTGVNRAIREGRSLDRAGRDLIREVRGFGKGQGLPKVLENLKQAGRGLALEGAGGDPDAQIAARKAWRKAYGRVEKYASTLVDKRGGYSELLQLLKNEKVQNLDKALNRWFDEKQRYNAERVIETESSSAYRARQAEQWEQEKVITHVYWRLNRGSSFAKKRRRKRFGAPVTGRRGRARKRGNKARSCICTQLADQRFPVEIIKEYPRGGHPWCRCWFEPIYETRNLARPLSDEDREWYKNLPQTGGRSGGGRVIGF